MALRQAPTKIGYPEELPIVERREELLAVIEANQVVVVAGETGSGKSTQLPKMCLELGRGVKGRIAHTQPRRIAARSVAERIAEELGVEVGQEVGYAVRFTDRVGPKTLLKLMTDGLLLAEIQRDPRLNRYDTIIIDEAHERSLTIDFLLGYLKRLLPTRPDLKVIVTSATIDTARFAAHFDGAPVVEVSGRTYPVEMRYRPLERDDLEPIDPIEGICLGLTELAAETTGDVLVFCAGERDIRDAVDAIHELGLANTRAIPLYGRLSVADQHRVFQRHTGRRVVVSTNVAETSLTVPGIVAVIDTGTARISRYSRRTKVQRLPIEPVSQSSADQRAGRCGRLGPGVCIRLYSHQDYDSRPRYTEPEIQRTNLAAVILQMAALGLGDIETFPFLDPPDTRTIRDGINQLVELSAVDPAGSPGEKGWLTKLGRKLARFPLDPRLGRMLIEADRNGSLREVSTIVAALSIQDPRERPTGKEQQAAQQHARFKVEGSDFLGLLALWDYLRDRRKELSSSQFRRMCRDEYLNYRRIREWQDVRGQLRDITDDLDMSVGKRPAEPDAIHRALLSGLLSQVGMKNPEGYEYRAPRGARFSISPGSSLFKATPRWVMAGELVETTRTWAHQVAAIDPAMVETVGGHVVKRTISDPWWEPDKGSAVAHETVTLFGLTLVAGRTVIYGRMDPVGARLVFIRHALVLGEWETHHAFAKENDRRIAEIVEMESRQRSAALMADDEALEAFFDARLPADVWSVRQFDRWWRDQRAESPDLLTFTPEALLAEGVTAPDPDDYPTVWHHGDLGFDLEYQFDPNLRDDGVTIEIPIEAVDRVDAATFEWQVPGLRGELIESLLRSLPKKIRTELIPIAETVDSIRTAVGPENGRLLEVLRREVAQRSGRQVLPDDFRPDRIPDHLVPRFRFVSTSGEMVAEGQDLDSLREAVRRSAREAVLTATHPLERSGLSTWPGDVVPDKVEIGGERNTVFGYPALVDEGDTVSLRVLASSAEQSEAMWSGTLRLLGMQLDRPDKGVRALLTAAGETVVLEGPHRSVATWLADCVDAAVSILMGASGGPAWDHDGFARLVTRVRSEISDVLFDVASTSLEILDVYREIAVELDAIPDVFEEAAMDMARQVNGLVYPGFVTGVGSHLWDVRRYLDGVTHRIDRLAENPARDRQRMVEVGAVESRHDHLVEALGPTGELMAIAWDLQELRMAVFAQSVGVNGTVSVERVRRSLEAAAHL